jgi:tetratricopeptide (TPR) repeat protein
VFKRLIPEMCLLLALAIAVPHLWAQNDEPNELKSRLDKAASLLDSGALDEARTIYQGALPALRSRGPSRELAEVLNALSNISMSSGQYDAVMSTAIESADVCRKLHDPACEARAHNDAGLAFSNLGRYPEAAEAFETALRLSDQGGDHETTVLVLNNLGNVYYYQARYTDALRTYDQAAQYVEKSSGEPWAQSWRELTRLNTATLYQRLGNEQRAISIYKEVLDAPNISPREIAHVLANLGILYRRLGDPEEALKSYHDAEKYYAMQQDNDGELGVLKNTGIVLALDLGRLNDALTTFDRALALARKTGNQREAMQAVLYRGETLYRMGRIPEAKREFQSALDLASQLGTVEEQWKAVYALGRIAQKQGRTELAEQNYRDAIQRIESLRSNLQLTRLRSDFLADKRDVYDALIKLLLDRKDAASAIEYMERSRARVFQDRSFRDRAKPASLSLASIQKLLPGDSALVEFWTGPENIAAVWLTREGTGISMKALSRAEMDQFAQLVSGLPDNLGADWRKSLERFVELMPAAVEPFSESRYPHLLVVPDGFLSTVPFELFPAQDGKLVLESHDLTYLPSAVLLMRGDLQDTPSLKMPWQNQLIAFGDPAVVGSGESTLLSARSADAGSFSALPASREEISGIARLIAGRARLYLGLSDKKPLFFVSARSGAALLHVSTHAVADMDNPERSRLLFSPDKPGEANDFVFLKELYDLDLRGVSLATLSACDTEKGRLVPGEGVQAFSRALLSAGARSALTTLWRVPDQPTSEFMQQFYYLLLKKHKSKAEALRLTKLEFLRSGTELSHPRYWAAFVLNGDGADPVPRFISWSMLAAPVLVVAAAVILILVEVRKKTARSERSKAVAVQR